MRCRLMHMWLSCAHGTLSGLLPRSLRLFTHIVLQAFDGYSYAIRGTPILMRCRRRCCRRRCFFLAPCALLAVFSADAKHGAAGAYESLNGANGESAAGAPTIKPYVPAVEYIFYMYGTHYTCPLQQYILLRSLSKVCTVCHSVSLSPL